MLGVFLHNLDFIFRGDTFVFHVIAIDGMYLLVILVKTDLLFSVLPIVCCSSVFVFVLLCIIL